MRTRRDTKPVNYADWSTDAEVTDTEDINTGDMMTLFPQPWTPDSNEVPDSDDESEGRCETDMTDYPSDRSDEEDTYIAHENSKAENLQSEDDKPDMRNAHYDPTKPGFLSLPPELRCKIYELLLVKKPCVDFGMRRGFSRSAGLLSTCSVIAKEGL